MLAHVPSFGRNPRGSPDFPAYPVPKACMHVLGTRVPRRLGVARSASSPKAAQALGCSLTPGLRISFGRVTCMARAASVPGLWALGFLLLACVCGWVRVAVGRGFCLPMPVVAWGLGWVCLGSVCGVVPLLPAVCGVRGWALVWACFRDLCGFLRVSLAPRRFRLRCAVGAPGSRLCPALLVWVVGLCFLRFFFFFFLVAGCPCPGPCRLSPVSFLSGAAGFFFFFSACFGVPFSPGPLSLAWCCRSWLGGPPVPVWGFCLWCPLGGGFGPLLCCWWAVWWLWAVFARPPPPPPFFFFSSGGGAAGLFLPLPSLGWRLVCGWCVVWLVPRHSWQWFLCATPRHSWLGFAAGGCGRSPPLLAGVCRRRWCLVCGGGVLVGLWLVCGVVGPSPLLAEVPVCYSPPLLAGFRFRWCWAGPATPGWGPLAALLCGVWCVAVVCWWGCGWCVVWLVPRHSWRRFLCATPRHSWLGFAAGGGGRSPPLLAGVRLRRWCVVCGVWCVAVVCGWGCGWCVVWLVPRHSWRRFLCATPRHSWLGFASGGGGRSPPLLAGVRWRRCCVVCGVWRWCVGGVVAGVWCGWSLATPGGGSCVLLPATPGWVSLPVVVGGPRHSWLGSACGGGVWFVVCGVWRWCVGGVVAGVWCGWSLATPGGGSCVLLPATPGWVSLPVVVGGPRHSWLGSVGGVAVWCVVCGAGVLVGLWLACGVVGPFHSWRRFLCATPRHSWLGFAAGGGGRSPPLLAGVRLRRWCVVCGVWCVAVVCWWGCGWCVVWLVPRHSWRRFLCATPRHSWLGFAAAGGGWSPPLLAGVLWRRWCVVCCWGPSPLLAEVPVCYSPPLLAGFRCRWWWAVPATPGWGPLAAVVCVFCLAGSGGPASRARCGAPHLFLWPLCLSALLGPLRAGVAPLSFAAVAVPRWLGFVVCGLAVAWHLFVCRGSLRVVRALRVCGTRRPPLLGTCPCALVVAGGVPLWRASWPRVVRRASSGPVALGAPVGFPDAVVPFPTPGACAPGFTGRLRGARGGRPRTGLIVLAAGPRRGRGAGLSASYPFGAPRWGCPWRVPPASVLGCVRCGGWRVWTRSLTRPVSRTVRLSTGDSAGAPGLFRVA